MEDHEKSGPVRGATSVMLIVLAICIAGCATRPGPPRGPATPLKGDATWDISKRQVDPDPLPA